MVFSSRTQPINPLRHILRPIIYDPHRHSSRKLRPFDWFVEVCREERVLTDRLENAGRGLAILLLIMPERDNLETRMFLEKFIPDQIHLHSLYIIFSNGIQFHEEWTNMLSMPRLRWCRSYTEEFVQDTLDFCRSACNTAIEFYRQQKKIQQDAFRRDQNNASKSLIILYASEWKKLSLFLKDYSQKKK